MLFNQIFYINENKEMNEKIKIEYGICLIENKLHIIKRIRWK